MTDAVYTPSELARIAGSICLFRQQMPSPAASGRARVSVARTIVQILSGMAKSYAKNLLEAKGLIAESGPALIVGTSRRTSVLDAAFVNGVASRAIDHTAADVMLDRRLAPGLALLLPIAETRAVAGETFLRAYLTGIETACALSRDDSADVQGAAALVVPAVAAASQIVALDPPRLIAAIELALKLVGGKGRGEYDEFGPIYSGYLGRAVLFAALFAESGFVEAYSSTGNKTTPRQKADQDSAGLKGFERAAGVLPPTSFDELWTEFDGIASGCLARDQVGPLFELLDNIDKVNDIRKLTRLLEAKTMPISAETITFARAGEHGSPETNWVP